MIDPVLGYASRVGEGDIDEATDIAIDRFGNMYATGFTHSAEFLGLSGEELARIGIGGSVDAFVIKLAPDGETVLFSTFLGGPADDRAIGIAVDEESNVYVTGTTSHLVSEFPTAPESFRVTRQNGDAFLVVVDPSVPGPDSLRYSTFIGGRRSDHGTDVAAGAFGVAYVAGHTQSDDLPDGDGGVAPKLGAGSLGAVQDVFVAKIDWTRVGDDSLVDAAYLGGSGSDIPLGIVADGLRARSRRAASPELQPRVSPDAPAGAGEEVLDPAASWSPDGANGGPRVRRYSRICGIDSRRREPPIRGWT